MHSLTQTEALNYEAVAQMKYTVISPVRNEAEFIERTLQSMTRQTIKPTEWIIVNDGSTDDTGQIVTRYAAQHPWIKLVNRPDRGSRQRGKGVVETFYTGFATISQPYDFIVKLDGDLSFEPDYFEALLAKFATNPKLGIAGGGVYEQPDGQTWILRTTTDHVRGATKVYRRTCFEAIGGLVLAMGWDGVDEWKALAQGWQVQSFLNLKVYHYRFTGKATGSLKSQVEQGYGAHYMGYHPLFMLARSVRYMFKRRPFIIGGAAMLMAYFVAKLRGRERLSDPAVIQFLRQTQLRQLAGLLTGKPVHK